MRVGAGRFWSEGDTPCMFFYPLDNDTKHKRDTQKQALRKSKCAYAIYVHYFMSKFCSKHFWQTFKKRKAAQERIEERKKKKLLDVQATVWREHSNWKSTALAITINPPLAPTHVGYMSCIC